MRVAHTEDSDFPDHLLGKIGFPFSGLVPRSFLSTFLHNKLACTVSFSLSVPANMQSGVGEEEETSCC